MTTIANWGRRAAATCMAVVLVGALPSPASSEKATYDFPKSPYVKSISIDNGDEDVVVRAVARKTGKSVEFNGWSVDIDTVAGHGTDFGAGEFTTYGPWLRNRVRLFSISDDGTYATTKITCAGLTSTLTGRTRTVVIPRSCLTYGDAAATAIRTKVSVHGFKHRRDGTNCWGVVAPKRGWSAWLDPDVPPIARATSSASTVARGC